jgi:hypothetical protein
MYVTAESGLATRATLENLKIYIREELERTPVIERLERMVREGSSLAGKSAEGVFSREFLCPVLRSFFYTHARSDLMNLTDEEIKRGLGTEGFVNCEGFGFTPGHKSNHLFTKSDIIKSRPPDRWFAAQEKALSTFQACPDFAIRSPLPFSIVGVTKYFKKGSPDAAVTELYITARQAVFYLGVFPGCYEAAMMVVADASPDHAFHEGLRLLKPELMERFGTATNVHLVTIRLI